LRIFKQAKKGNFDFQNNKNSKIGVIRTFVRDLQNNGKLDSNIHDETTEEFFTYESSS